MINSENTVMLFFEEKSPKLNLKKQDAEDDRYEFTEMVNNIKHYLEYEKNTNNKFFKVLRFVLRIKI